ncbi:PREDICTED: thyroid peroxidase-like [Acropora digitifera]|uniref:thyroid peroxidase-like n=1 Tax=Acropora digitifera TaxID=70779 RepID=UPI00077AD067|nr:PREDICTED: thyroid peroxidase-like [Acropora digitifera]
MRVIRFLLAIFLTVSTSEVRRVLSSEAAASLTLQTLLEKNCDSLKTRLACLSSPYRSFDGSCNNLCNTTLGMAGTTLARFPNLIRPTAYDNPVTFTARQNSAAVSFIGTPLPNARNVSVQVFDASEEDATGAPNFTHLTMTWGQFVDHDVTLTETTPLPENVTCGTNEAACVVDGQNCIGVDIIHPSPFGPSQVLGGLPTAKCIPLTRSTRTPEGQQINIITHYLDGSQVYGSDSKTIEALRDPTAQMGLMDVRPFSTSGSLAQPILPPQEEGLFCRSPDPERIPCLRGGDERANDNQGNSFQS